MLNTATSIVQLNNLVVGSIVMCLKDRSMGVCLGRPNPYYFIMRKQLQLPLRILFHNLIQRMIITTTTTSLWE